MTAQQRTTPTAIAEAAWRHLVNRHDLAQALDELDAPPGPDELRSVAAQLRSGRSRPAPIPALNEGLNQ